MSDMDIPNYLPFGVPPAIHDELNALIHTRIQSFQSACTHAYCESSFGMCIDSPKITLIFNDGSRHQDYRYYPTTCRLCGKRAFIDRLLNKYVDTYERDPEWRKAHPRPDNPVTL